VKVELKIRVGGGDITGIECYSGDTDPPNGVSERSKLSGIRQKVVYEITRWTLGGSEVGVLSEAYRRKVGERYTPVIRLRSVNEKVIVWLHGSVLVAPWMH
jgi:hypothetical protein